MSIDYKVWTLPPFPVSTQIFHVPGGIAQGGLTSGGARISSPEPGGFAILEIKPSLNVDEWTAPLASWLISKTNGAILRTRLARTPQVASPRVFTGGEKFNGADLVTTHIGTALQGTTLITIDTTYLGQMLRAGHVIGHEFDCYLIDEITYSANTAQLRITPPLRRNVYHGHTMLLRPWFTGSIANPGDLKNAYDASMAGHIQLENIILNEVII